MAPKAVGADTSGDGGVAATACGTSFASNCIVTVKG
jgi:hypothetical protein